ncbi:MAG: O-antigen ligase family protein [Candidatus Paceibacterota bacterium]|jgi:tetratricopeptide (TPR) repeat protein
MTNNQIKYFILAGLFIIPFVVLVVSSSLFFPFITGKAFVFRTLVEVVFAGFLILAMRDKSYRPKFSWILGSLVTFLVVMGVADFFGQNSFKAFWSNYERMEGYITLLHLGAYFLVLGSVLKTEQLWNRLLATSLGVSAIMAVYSFLQLAGKITINQGGVRVDGTLGNAGYLGIYMVFHIFFAALLFVRFRQNWQKILLGVVALMDLVVLYFTATRGAILGLVGGALITFGYLLFKSHKGEKIRKIALGGVLALVVFVGLFVAFKNTAFVQKSPVLGRFASLSISEIETQGRYFVWPMAIKGFVEKPILGWGQEGFNFVFNKYYDPKMYNQEPWFDRAHSTPLDWLIAGGALGLLSYLSIIFALLYYIFKIKSDSFKKEEKAIVLGLISAYFFNNLFVFDQISSYILFFILLAYVHSHSTGEASPRFDKFGAKLANIFESEKWRPMLEALVIILTVVVLYFVIYAPWQQNKDLLEVLQLNNQSKIGALEVYNKPLSGYGMGFSESLEHISQTAINIAANTSVPVEFKQNLFNNIDKAFGKQLSVAPNDTRYRLFYGLFLSRFGLYSKAIEQLQTAQKLSPKKQQIYFELVNNFLADGKIAQAVQSAKTAFELEPSYEEARIVYGLTLLASGDKTLSDEILKSVPESKIIFDDRYLSVLLSLKRFSEIIDVAQKRFVLDPTNLQHKITLTAAYLQAGRRLEAVQTLQEIIRLDPTFKEKGDFYIKEIEAGRNP